MKIECDIEKLKDGVVATERVTGKNLTLPVLSSILIIASGKTLKLRSTNLSLGLEVEIPAKIEKEGVVAVNGNTLAHTLSNIFEKGTAILEDSNGNLGIKTKKSKIKLKGQPHDDFPTIPTVSGKTLEIEARKFVEGMKSVYYSSSPSDIKPEISSVYIYSDDDNLTFVSTDSFRLAEKKIRARGLGEIKGILIPFKNVGEIMRTLGDKNSVVKISFNKNQISFSMENIYLTSRVIDGNFPDYRQIIPKESKTKAVLLKEDMLNALKLSNIFSDKFNQVNLRFAPKERSLELTSASANVGENKTVLEAALEGEAVELGFNYRYFLDCFQSLNTDSLEIKLNGEAAPMIIRPVSDSSFTYLIMPMNK